MKFPILKWLGLILVLVVIIEGPGVIRVPAAGQQKRSRPPVKQTDPTEVRRLNEQFKNLSEAGKYDEALLVGNRLLEIFHHALGQDHPAVATILSNLGMIYINLNDYAKAESLLRRAISIAERSLGKWDPVIATYLTNLAEVYEAEGNYIEAESVLEGALAINIRSRKEESLETATILYKLAGFALGRGDSNTALKFCQQSLRIRENALGPEHEEVAITLSRLGTVYEEMGNYFRAEIHYKRALAVIEKKHGPDNPKTVTALFDLGILYDIRGEPDQAEEVFNRVLGVYEKTGGPDNFYVALILNSLGIIYVEKGDYDKAEQVLQRALKIIEKEGALKRPEAITVLRNIAKLYQAKDDNDRAIMYMKRCNELRDSTLTLMLETGSEAQKQAYMETVSSETNITISLNAIYGSKNVQAARLALTALLRRKGRILGALADSLRVLRNRMNPADRKLLDQLISVRSRLAQMVFKGPGKADLTQYRTQLSDLEVEEKTIEAAVSARSAEYGVQSQPVTIEQVQAMIPEGAVLVEIASYLPLVAKFKSINQIWGDARYVAYVLLSKGDPLSVDLGEAAPIDKNVEALRAALRNPNRSDVKKIARKLDEQVTQPIRKLMGDARIVLISPDGTLNLIPFGALVDDQDRYLLERFEFIYLTSGRDVLRLRSRSASRQGPIILAAPDFDNAGTLIPTASSQTALKSNGRRSRDFSGERFEPLPNTAREASLLAKILPDAKVFTGQQATETVLKQSQGPSILHIATHGFFLADQLEQLLRSGSTRSEWERAESTYIENPLLRSGIALVGANKLRNGTEDGVLTAMEAAGLDLHGTRLVVMSACETGLGDINKGEGVYGLRRALVIAGSETQVMSLWKVDDEATSELMVAYYRGLLSGNGRSAALRKVQLCMLQNNERECQDRQHPYYWAGFIVSGNWTNLEGK